VLDLYAGAGGLGLEALSRGADRVLFVEANRAAGRVLRRNVAAVVRRLAIAPGFAEIWETDAAEALRRLGLRGRRFSLILADPPYAATAERGAPAGESLVTAVGEIELLLPGGWLVLEHGRGQEMCDAAGPLRRWATREYGRTAVSYWFVPLPRQGAEEGARG